MKIGIFDSGMGGLIVANGIIRKLPQYDYIFLGDTARVPYGNRSAETVYSFTRQGVEYLLEQGCGLVVIACNTASADALRRLQKEFLPGRYPDRHLLGVLVPAVESAVATTRSKRIGVLATRGTVASKAFAREIQARLPEASVTQKPAPLLVPLVEYAGLRWARPILEDYLYELQEADIDTLILGCTHYPVLRPLIEDILGEKVSVVSQDLVVPNALEDYLKRQTQLANKLTSDRTRQFMLTDITRDNETLASRLFGEKIEFTKVELG
jgi:glutamate racemase